jgi:hypothetical protein
MKKDKNKLRTLFARTYTETFNHDGYILLLGSELIFIGLN